MIKVENIDVYNFKNAVRGMRNPLNSWDKSDSTFFPDYDEGKDGYIIGVADLDLMKRLYKAGTEHRKYLRQIFVSLDITAPLYWWKEFDTYKIGTTSNSCSTMHKITSKIFTLDDFSVDHLERNIAVVNFKAIIKQLNDSRDEYLSTKDKKYWYNIIQLLPSSYMQKRTIDLNYQTLRRIYFARRNHKLDEWHMFCDWIKTLDYGEELITYAPGMCDNVSYVGGSNASN